MPLKKATQAVISPNICTTDTTQTITGTKTFANANITGNLTGNAGTATTLQTARTIATSGAVTGTATLFKGDTNITIPTTITSGATIDSPVFSGTASGELTTKVIKGVTDGVFAMPGFLGQTLQATTSPATTIASGTTVNALSLGLTTGQWAVSGSATFNFIVTPSTNNGVIISTSTIGVGINDNNVTPTLQSDRNQILLLSKYFTSSGVETSLAYSPAFELFTPQVRFNITGTGTVTVFLAIKAPTYTQGIIQYIANLRATRIL